MPEREHSLRRVSAEEMATLGEPTMHAVVSPEEYIAVLSTCLDESMAALEEIRDLPRFRRHRRAVRIVDQTMRHNIVVMEAMVARNEVRS